MRMSRLRCWQFIVILSSATALGGHLNQVCFAPITTAHARSDIPQSLSEGPGDWPVSSVLRNDAGSNAATMQSSGPSVTTGKRWMGDPWEHPRQFMIGGHGAFQGGALSIYGAPWTYGNSGSLLDIEMTNTPWFASRGGAGVYDAVGQFIAAQNTTPYYKIGQGFTDDEGAKHQLVFDGNGVTVIPKLPKSFEHMWRNLAPGRGGGGILVFTNLKAGEGDRPPEIPGFPSVEYPNLWVGYITDYKHSQDGGSTHLDMSAGWHPYNSWVGANGPNNHAVPDTSNLDKTIYRNYHEPTLFIGTYAQAFAQNMKCAVNRDHGGDVSKTLLRNDSPMRSCQGNELDYYIAPDFLDGEVHLQGFTADLTSVTPLPAPNSPAFVAQGNWPLAFYSGVGIDGREFSGNNLSVNSRRGPKGQIGISTELMETRQGADAPTDVRSNDDVLRVTQRVDTINGQMTGVGTHFPTDNSLHMGEWFGGPQYGQNSSLNPDYGTYVADLVMNPGWAKMGAALCGKANQYKNTPTGCLTVMAGGQIIVQPDQTERNTVLSVAPAGFTPNNSGVGGVIIGSMPQTSITAYGAYLPSGYNHSIEEYVVGREFMRSLDAYGNEALAGNLAIGPGKALILRTAQGQVGTYIHNDPAGNMETEHGSGGTGNLHVKGTLSGDAVVLPSGPPPGPRSHCITNEVRLSGAAIYVCVSPNRWKHASLVD